jgi:hypothetical protein
MMHHMPPHHHHSSPPPIPHHMLAGAGPPSSSSNNKEISLYKPGRWSLDEKLCFLYGLQKFGKGRWKKISIYLPQRYVQNGKE